MTFKLIEVPRTDPEASNFPALIQCMWDAFETPLQPFFYIFAPPNANGTKTRAEAVQESIDRFWSWYDPGSVWLKVVDADTKQIVGGALWRIHEENPYENCKSEQEPYWHPEGGQREFARQVLEEHEKTRALLARRPHLYLNIIFTRPEFQRQGIGSTLMDWGITKAKEVGCELWLDARPSGRPLYLKYGFTTINHIKHSPKVDNPNADWRNFEAGWDDPEELVMWRPKEGPYVAGQSVKPWET